jgi:hypothetical protein
VITPDDKKNAWNRKADVDSDTNPPKTMIIVAFAAKWAVLMWE